MASKESGPKPQPSCKSHLIMIFSLIRNTSLAESTPECTTVPPEQPWFHIVLTHTFLQGALAFVCAAVAKWRTQMFGFNLNLATGFILAGRTTGWYCVYWTGTDPEETLLLFAHHTLTWVFSLCGSTVFCCHVRRSKPYFCPEQGLEEDDWAWVRLQAAKG